MPVSDRRHISSTDQWELQKVLPLRLKPWHSEFNGARRRPGLGPGPGAASVSLSGPGKTWIKSVAN
jgi:hypothetical protein